MKDWKKSLVNSLMCCSLMLVTILHFEGLSCFFFGEAPFPKEEDF